MTNRQLLIHSLSLTYLIFKKSSVLIWYTIIEILAPRL